MKKYLYAFLITALIFVTALYIGNFFSDRKIQELKDAGNKISIDILSSETQFALLGEISCPDIKNSTLSKEMDDLGEKINYSQEKFGVDNSEVLDLKKYYSILEIKDYILTKKLKDCEEKPIPILYFYESDCPDCDREGYVLTYLREHYPELRVYSFDYNLDVSALKTLASVYGIGKKLPAIVIKNKPYTGFQTIEEIKKLLPELREASSTTQTL
ncbi:MAG: hypothetical protein V4467_02650 [Patescibacteria group bacterium]